MVSQAAGTLNKQCYPIKVDLWRVDLKGGRSRARHQDGTKPINTNRNEESSSPATAVCGTLLSLPTEWSFKGCRQQHGPSSGNLWKEPALSQSVPSEDVL